MCALTVTASHLCVHLIEPIYVCIAFYLQCHLCVQWLRWYPVRKLLGLLLEHTNGILSQLQLGMQIIDTEVHAEAYYIGHCLINPCGLQCGKVVGILQVHSSRKML